MNHTQAVTLSAATSPSPDGTWEAKGIINFDGKPTVVAEHGLAGPAEAAAYLRGWLVTKLNEICRVGDDAAVEDKLAKFRTETPVTDRGVFGAKKAKGWGEVGSE